MPTPDILCLGEPLVEFNRRPDGLWLGGHGGDSSNCAVAAARQGASVGYLSRVGDDPFGHDLLDLWRAEGVDTTGVRVDPQAPTGVYFVTHGPEGHVFTYRRAGSAATFHGTRRRSAQGCAWNRRASIPRIDPGAIWRDLTLTTCEFDLAT